MNDLTPEQIRDNYEYKIVKRTLINEFPWIKDVLIDEEDFNKYSTIFLILVIDPNIIEQEYGFKLNSWVTNLHLNKGYSYDSIEPGTIFNISLSEGSEIFKDKPNKIIKRIHNSKALPEELKLPEKTMSVFKFIVPPDTTSGE